MGRIMAMFMIMGAWMLVALSIAFGSPLWIITILIGSLTAAIIGSLKLNQSSYQRQVAKRHTATVPRKSVAVS